MEKREKKPKSKARKITEWVLFVIFGVLAAVVLAGNVSSMIHKKENYGQSIRFGMGTFVILTTSMEPDIGKGTMIITFKEDVKTFDTRLGKGEKLDVTFANIDVDITDFEPDTPEFKKENGGTRIVTNQVMTHRLREVHINEEIAYGKGRYIFVTSGINTGGEHALEGQYQVFTEVQYLGTVKVVNAFLGNFMSFISSPLGLIVLLLIPAGYLIVVSSIDIYKAVKEDENTDNSPAKLEGDHLSRISEKDKERLKNELLEEMIKAKKEGKKNE